MNENANELHRFLPPCLVLISQPFFQQLILGLVLCAVSAHGTDLVLV